MQINAIKLRPENHFTWASGWKSPIYCDNRIMLSYPSVRSFVTRTMAEQVTALYGRPDVIAGVATGAIGIGILVADLLDLPFVYVRPEAKAHGRQNQVEGKLDAGQRVVVIEDLISTGRSSLNAVDALVDEGAGILGMLAIFDYGFSVAEDNFAAKNVTLHTLGDYDHLIQQLAESGQITDAQLGTLREWRQDPAQWQQP